MARRTPGVKIPWAELIVAVVCVPAVHHTVRGMSQRGPAINLIKC